MQRKTDSSGRPENLLPGSWNRVPSPSPNTKKRGWFPIQIGSRSDLNREDGFGSVGRILTEVKVKIKKHLPQSDRRPVLALVVP